MSRTCPLCLETRSEDTIYHIKKCDCPICWQCMSSYVELMVHEGRVIQMACPVNKCRNSFLSSNEIKSFLSERRYARYLELKFLKEIELDPRLTFCPRPGCETVCQIEEESTVASRHRRKRGPIRSGNSNKSKSNSSATRADQVRSVDSMMPLPAAAWRTRRLVKALTCPKCALTFCNACKIEWHPNETCEQANARRRPEERSVFYLFSSSTDKLSVVPKAANGDSQPGPSSAANLSVAYKKADDSSREALTAVTPQSDSLPSASGNHSADSGAGSSAESEPEPTVKPCPVCAMPIERDAGCAQMLCERCRHLFCWYCLKLLDNDYFLRHYDSGPCRAKLGHSRSAVHWHRVQVAAMFAGIGLLALLASPFLILAAPCIICCRPGAVTSFTRKLTGRRHDERDEPDVDTERPNETENGNPAPLESDGDREPDTDGAQYDTDSEAPSSNHGDSTQACAQSIDRKTKSSTVDDASSSQQTLSQDASPSELQPPVGSASVA